MGIAETDFGHWAYLSPKINWHDVRSVCDLGQQELFTGSPDAMVNNMAAFLRAVDVDCRVDVQSLIAERWIRDIWKRLGREIYSIDVVGSGDDYLKLDLNVESVPPEYYQRFDLVTNCGTTEHVFNQFNCFKVMHDLTKPGGYMYHSLPCSGMTSHGFFSYNTKIFSLLALANNYVFLDAFMTVDPNVKHLDDESRSLMRQDKDFLKGTVHGTADHLTHDYKATDAGIRVCLQKRHDAGEFKPPLDIRAENIDVYGNTLS